MKKLSFSELKKLSAQELRKGQCLEITVDGETIGIFIVSPHPSIHEKYRALASMIDAGKPREE